MPMERLCVCIPLRAAVILLSSLLTIGSCGAVAMLIWMKTDILETFPADLQLLSNILYYAALGISGAYVLISPLGLIGGIWCKRVLVQILSIGNWILLLPILTGMVGIWGYVLANRQRFVNDCVNWSLAFSAANMTGPGFNTALLPPAVFQSTTQSGCDDTMQLFITWWGIGAFVGGFLLIYFSSSIGAYAGKLYRKNQPKNELLPYTQYSSEAHKPLVPELAQEEAWMQVRMSEAEEMPAQEEEEMSMHEQMPTQESSVKQMYAAV
ncbi:hypothetical protein BC937DRAFT_89028 [Endogone sp. FLAS-F59071]|nr:hypothetical protein BC937DRAFT_89028 [Endogone sp. FLAS-F59071]|eukprot:RUS18212.1 hypothetical protein BC937DRAFT_89028 [Endogone sp. FLAS-F59071]